MIDVTPDHPWDSYSHARYGLYATTLDQIEVFQHIRAPNVGREQPGRRDARFAIALCEGTLTIDFDRRCFISFNDRFYKPEEAVIIIQATLRSRRLPPLLDVPAHCGLLH